MTKCNFSLNDYRVYLSIVTLIDKQNTQPQEEPTREYTLSAKEFSEQFNVDLKNSYRVLKNFIYKLQISAIYIKQSSSSKKTSINIFEKSTYNENKGSITLLLTGSIMEYLKQLTNYFTLYNLKEIIDLTSIYAVRLYELIQKLDTRTGMLIHTIEQWRELLGVLPEQYSTYKNLKQKVFMQALNEINTKTAYTVIMTEEKEGRKVVEVGFQFTTKKHFYKI